MYIVKVLSEAEFEKLPYKHVKTSLGLADAKAGVAYVRDTGYNDITKKTIEHELDELMAKVSPHEEDGIRYKNLKSLGAGAGAGLISSIFPGLRGFSPAISAGAGALAGKKGSRISGALQGFTGGGLSSGVGGGLYDTFKGVRQPGGTFGKALTNFVPGVERGLKQYAGAVPGFGGVGTSTPTGALAKFFSKGAAVPGGAAGAASPRGNAALEPFIPPNVDQLRAGTPTAVPTSPSLPPTLGSDTPLKPKFDIGESLKQAIPGLAISGLGDLLAPKVQVPDTSGIQARLEKLVATGGEPVAKEAGLKELFRILGEPIGTPPAAAFNQGDIYADRQLTQDLTNLRNEFKAVNPNANVDNNSAFLNKKYEIIRDRSEQRTAARDALSFDFERQQLQTKFNTMQEALNLDQSQIAQYISLAQLEVDQLMLQYGIDSETATKFKQMFADLGRLNIQQGQNSGIDSLFAAAANAIQNEGVG